MNLNLRQMLHISQENISPDVVDLTCLEDIIIMSSKILECLNAIEKDKGTLTGDEIALGSQIMQFLRVNGRM